MNDKLAMFGGEKAVISGRNDFVWPRITEDMKVTVTEQMDKTISIYDDSDIFGIFERKFADFHNRKYALLGNSGTSAILAMFEAIGITSGSKILCPVYTFHATISPAVYLGAIPIFCDTDSEGNISVESIMEKYTNDVAAVIITHMWGNPVKDVERIVKFCKDKHIFLLEDCSHAHGAEIYGKKVGTFGDMAAWSLQGQKTITGGEGGILLTDNYKLFERALLHGHYNKRPKMQLSKDSELYEYALTGMGLKLRAHPLAIALANNQFDKLQVFLGKRHEYAKMFIECLKEYEFIETLNDFNENIVRSWYAFPFLYDERKAFGISRQLFFQALEAEGMTELSIGGATTMLNKLSLFTKPNKLLSSHKTELPVQNGFSNCEAYCKKFLKLPVWTFDDERDIVEGYVKGFDKVCQHIKNYHTLERS